MAANLNQTPSAERPHIAFFGKRNAGKSSLVNAITGQEISIVADFKGTTTDPVTKAMELLPLGPVVIIDTPGIDDEGLVGELRVKKARQILNKTDIAVLVVDSVTGKSEDDKELIQLFIKKEIPYLIVYNKSDIAETVPAEENSIRVSAITNANINELKEKIASLIKNENESKKIVSDLLNEDDVVILVTPIDSSAPKGRMILPQVQSIRDVIDKHAICIVVQPEQLKNALKFNPKMVITDSQIFSKVKDIVPENIPLTSFSILFARYKGLLRSAVDGVNKLSSLKDNDIILICEGCTHHRQCEDIGTVKLPGWISDFTGKKLNFEFTSGGQFPEKLEKYALIVHCGGCMLNEREIRYRNKSANDAGVPITNYGTLIAHINGILERSIEIFQNNL
ncbi:MAG: [FeFe] hydrogenase H-cluster maturation GTPase HydF [Ruminococcaceae bacterium]|nr:[FeFe] hydrogenase H-cluster maturation GTPase HydF [Oscillospiraceae bacterium]